LLAQLAVLLLSTGVVFIDAGEQAVLERFGKPVASGVLTPGRAFEAAVAGGQNLPYHTDQIQSFVVGYTPDTQSENANTILWSVSHAKEDNFLVGNLESVVIKNENADTNDMLKAPPVSLIAVNIPVQFQITDVRAWAYNNADPIKLLQDLATREVVHYLASADLDAVMSHTQLEAAQELRVRIQAAADKCRLGAKIIFVGLQGIHPPVKVAGDYEKSSVRNRRSWPQFSMLGPSHSHKCAGWRAGIHDDKRRRCDAATAHCLGVCARRVVHKPDSSVRGRAIVYRQRAYFQTFADATARARKYILLVTNTQDVVIFDLEDKIREDLLNLNVSTNSSP